MNELDEIRRKKLEELKKKLENNKAKVIIYTTPTCPYCKLAKRYFETLNVPYTEIDVSRDQKAAMDMYMKSGQLGVPQIEIGDEIIIGFDKTSIDLALKNHRII